MGVPYSKARGDADHVSKKRGEGITPFICAGESNYIRDFLTRDRIGFMLINHIMRRGHDRLSKTM